MKKKVLALLLALAMALSLAACGAHLNRHADEDETPDAEEAQVIREESVNIDGEIYTGVVFTDGVIHAILNPATGVLMFLGNGAIADHDDWANFTDAERRLVKTIIIGAGITSIDSYEFDGDYIHSRYQNLKEVDIHASLNSIGHCAFSDNVNLEKVTFEDGSSCRHIGDRTFAGCYALEVVEGLPDAVSYGYDVFRDCPFRPEGYTDGYDNVADWTALD